MGYHYLNFCYSNSVIDFFIVKPKGFCSRVFRLRQSFGELLFSFLGLRCPFVFCLSAVLTSAAGAGAARIVGLTSFFLSQVLLTESQKAWK